MSLKLGVVMDPIEAITYKKDSTLAMLWAAQDRGWQLYYLEQSGLYLRDGVAMGKMAELSVKRDPNDWFERGEYQHLPLTELDVVLMRKDPPFDNEYLYSTHLLEQAERDGLMVVNPPQRLRDCNEKLFATQFPQCCPPVLVSRDPQLLKDFHAEHQDVIFKPLDGMGGSSIFRVREDDPNLNVVLETLTDHGRQQIMAQRFIPEISDGDKRILLIDGEPVDYTLARIPSQGETRGNLAAGGTGVGRPLSDRDRWICEQVKPVIQELGLLFVGLDVIGDYLTEINVTSPTCIRELNDQFGLDIAGQLMDAIADRLDSVG
ncbi:glutathione synthase [Motiliproteus coralliicola]|uniref:Glutathione synthetase n=1 Tax=Motiliproteus coralliicola TaxID=2283196 RepID=A0A369WB76_9GAMM|nr:glutathione synthase [Motiliproteus coralliicola]RDE18907.1 glutathione synthase [Motiliproteus coralliicola]